LITGWELGFTFPTGDDPAVMKKFKEVAPGVVRIQ
jgi:hypothetical protein